MQTNSTVTFPQKLHAGDVIGIISPGSPMLKERLKKGIAYLENQGYEVRVGEHVHDEYGYLAGTDTARAEDINRMFADEEVRAIFCSRGGYGTPRLLNLVDYEIIENNPKIFVGYSDITALQLAFFARTRLVTFSGPMAAVEMAKGMDAFTEKHFWRMLTEIRNGARLTEPSEAWKCLKPGQAKGPLLGGCLSLICALLGTPYFPDFQDAILFIEDIGEQPYQIDRHLHHLKMAGVLNRLRGMVVGQFEDCAPDPDSPSLTIEQVLDDVTRDLNFPVLSGLPYGHIDVKYTLPLGVQVALDADRGELQIIESPVV
ncbi:MAG: LD-carboxypeptidase [bacterium]